MILHGPLSKRCLGKHCALHGLRRVPVSALQLSLELQDPKGYVANIEFGLEKCM